MKKGDLIGYMNLDGDTEWGLVTSDGPFMYRPTERESAYLAVTVVWPHDPVGASVTHESVNTILDDHEENSGIWLQSSSPVR